MKRIHEERDARVIEMWNDGRKVDEIADACHVSPANVYEIARRERVRNPGKVKRRYSHDSLVGYREGIRRERAERLSRFRPDATVNVKTAAALAGCSTAAILNGIRRGRIRAEFVKGRYQMKVAALQAWVGVAV